MNQLYNNNNNNNKIEMSPWKKPAQHTSASYVSSGIGVGFLASTLAAYTCCNGPNLALQIGSHAT